MSDFKVSVAPNGRLVLPAALRKKLNLGQGGTLVIHDEGGRFVLESTDDAVRRAQALVRRFAPDASGVVDEFLAERRAEAAGEDRS
ncbi:AbrB/MazE/SpoVT family DNA-binding domain-containing protein [Methylobacterium sp. ID0610]|uniref:AbrB/MazE/SpoVT family DNA-binding domain-containing protein n=1 Tax=Methylobacterium carpenticola TaxID=3344827 RepID=UPI0036B7A841